VNEVLALTNERENAVKAALPERISKVPRGMKPKALMPAM